MLTWPAPKSLWLSELGPIVPADQVTSDLDYDVAIAGAGYTGLWTAYYLKKSDPSLRIGVFEAKFAGFGASGRNGGWASALFASSKSKVARLYGADAAKRLYRSLAESIDEIGKVVASEDIDADFHKGGTLFLARNQAQLERLGQELETERSFGFGEEDFRLLGAVEAKERIGASDVLGAGFTSNCARIHPAKLARGLRDVVVGLGVRVHEASVVTSIGPDGMEVNGCKVRAGAMIDALEGYRSSLRGGSRFTVPVYSLMIATEPLDDDLMEAVGLRDFETFADERHLIIYGQRSADNRIVFGGRGAPYHFASGISPSFDKDESVFAHLAEALVELMPALAGVQVTHSWGGPLGVPRDFFSSVAFDRGTGMGYAGGYVGDGVTTTNLAGRILADLIRGVRSDVTDLCIVGHPRKPWEPEPFRYLGINAGLRMAGAVDAAEWRGRPAPWYSGILLSMIGQ
ncbi:MAG: FAD-dependent oxidoreductase [Actinomycetota bacterium]|nr:FAD-dependent oxidoreductase [Actinomycetota bacterium]